MNPRLLLNFGLAFVSYLAIWAILESTVGSGNITNNILAFFGGSLFLLLSLAASNENSNILEPTYDSPAIIRVRRISSYELVVRIAAVGFISFLLFRFAFDSIVYFAKVSSLRINIDFLLYLGSAVFLFVVLPMSSLIIWLFGRWYAPVSYLSFIFSSILIILMFVMIELARKIVSGEALDAEIFLARTLEPSSPLAQFSDLTSYAFVITSVIVVVLVGSFYYWAVANLSKLAKKWIR